MSEVESISHSGMTAPDTWEAQRFYEEVLGGAAMETVTRSYRGDRGGEAHPCSTIGDYLFVSFPRVRDMAPPDQLRGGYENCRHGFAVLHRTRLEPMQQVVLVLVDGIEEPSMERPGRYGPYDATRDQLVGPYFTGRR